MVWQFITDLFKGVFWSFNSIATWIGIVALILFFLPIYEGKMKDFLEKYRKPYVLYVFPWFIIISIILASYSIYENNEQQPKTITLIENNSPDINQSATQSGSNNQLVQVAPGGTYNSGITEEMHKTYIAGMEAIQKKKDIELRAEFKYGYILFTATERNEIIPLNSPMDDVLIIDWNAGYKITFSDNDIYLHLPTISYVPTKVTFIGFAVRLPKNEMHVSESAIDFGRYQIAFKVISAKEDSIIIAMGIRDGI